MTTDATLHAAVIAGLAVGIGFVIVFSIFSTPSLMNSDGSDSAVTLGKAGQTISVDFGVALPERDMIVKKGETVRVPVTIETMGNLEKVLSLSIMPYTFDREAPDAGQLALSLDKESVVLSKDNIAQGKARMGDNIIIGYGWVITNAGFLTITASPTATTGGPYEYIVEARYAGEVGGVGMGSGQLFTVTVTD
jgi:hypothetical protein